MAQVTWQDEASDPGNPKNWAKGRKAKALFGMSLFVFISLFAVSLVAPTLPAISSELHIEQPAVQEMVLSIFLLGFAFGPLVASLLSETGDTRYHTHYDHLDHVTARVLSQNLIRPFKLLATQPIVQVTAFYNAFLYGNTYIFYADFITLWTDRYHQSVQIAGVNYVSIAISSGLATVIYTMTIDRIYQAMWDRTGGKGSQNSGFQSWHQALSPGVGLFWYGWSAEAVIHWIMPNIGCAIFVAGATVCTNSVNAYIVDTYGQYSASAIAAISILRCLAGLTFPLFAPYIYDRLGYGWAATVLGLIALGIGFPAVGLLWKFGAYLGQRSPYSSAEKAPETQAYRAILAPNRT